MVPNVRHDGDVALLASVSPAHRLVTNRRQHAALRYRSRYKLQPRGLRRFPYHPAMNKREFLRRVGGCTLGALLGERTWERYSHLPPATLAPDEDMLSRFGRT